MRTPEEDAELFTQLAMEEMLNTAKANPDGSASLFLTPEMFMKVFDKMGLCPACGREECKCTRQQKRRARAIDQAMSEGKLTELRFAPLTDEEREKQGPPLQGSVSDIASQIARACRRP